MPESFLSVENLNNLQWKQPSEETQTNLNAVTIWRINVADFIPYIENLQALLHPQEVEKIKRYQQEYDRQQRIISKAVLRILLSRYTSINPKEILFSADQNKKPFLANSFANDLHFNVSHSGNWILIAISDNSIGIDLEKMDASFTYQNMLSFSFNLQEINYIEQSEMPHQSFYKLWTRKESLLKATGKGLVDDLSKVPSLDGIHPISEAIIQSNQSWKITSFKVDENHIGSVTFNPIKTVLQFLTFSFD